MTLADAIRPAAALLAFWRRVPDYGRVEVGLRASTASSARRLCGAFGAFDLPESTIAKPSRMMFDKAILMKSAS
jgi:hypothetical protein